MLAEIYLLRLENAARALNEMTATNNARFVPFTQTSDFPFKDKTVIPAELTQTAA